MSIEDRKKWNQRYAEGSYEKNNPVTLLEEWLPKFHGGKALDVACGAGRNSILLAEAGYQVDAIDISAEGLKQVKQAAKNRSLHIHCIEHDFDNAYTFDTDYDLIVVMWYVNMPLITELCKCLSPGGYLLCQEHLVTTEKVIGPRNPDFRVQPNELREAVTELTLQLYEESVDPVANNEQVASARLIACKG